MFFTKKKCILRLENYYENDDTYITYAIIVILNVVANTVNLKFLNVFKRAQKMFDTLTWFLYEIAFILLNRKKYTWW